MGFLLQVLSNSIGLWLANYYIPGFGVSGSLKNYFLAGILLGLLNVVLRPILKLISWPLIILTLGLFNIAIHAGIVWLIASTTHIITIESIAALILATVILIISNLFARLIAKIL